MTRLKLRGASLYLEEVGTGEPLVLLHGLGSSGQDWSEQVAFFGGRYRCIIPDARGSGRSRDLEHPSGPFSISQLAADAAAVLDRLGLERVHLVGLSMGGMTALQLALDSPRLVHSLVLVNSGASVVPRTWRESLQLAVRMVLTRALGPRAVAKMVAPRLFPRADQLDLRRRFEAQMADNEPGAYLALTRAIVGWSVERRLDELRCPTLLLCSEHDYTPVAAKESVANRIERAEVQVVPDAHHALPIEDAHAFNAALDAWLRRRAFTCSRAATTA